MSRKFLATFILAVGASCAAWAAIDQSLVFHLTAGVDGRTARYPVGSTTFRHPDGDVFATAVTEDDGSTTFLSPDGAVVAYAVSAYAAADRDGNRCVRDVNGNITAILPAKGPLGDRELKNLAAAPVDHTSTTFRGPDGTILAVAITDHGGKTSFLRADGKLVATANDDHNKTSFRGPDGKTLATALAADNGQTIFRDPKGGITTIVTTVGPMPAAPLAPPPGAPVWNVIYVTNEYELVAPARDGNWHRRGGNKHGDQDDPGNGDHPTPGGKKVDLRIAGPGGGGVPPPRSKKVDIDVDGPGGGGVPPPRGKKVDIGVDGPGGSPPAPAGAKVKTPAARLDAPGGDSSKPETKGKKPIPVAAGPDDGGHAAPAVKRAEDKPASLEGNGGASNSADRTRPGGEKLK